MTPTRPRRVAILIDSLSPGGAERIAVEAAAALDVQRYVPHLVVTRAGGPLEQLVRDRDLQLTVLDRRRGFAPRKLARALSIVRDSSIVHAHLWGSAMWGALLARAARRPLVAHAHRFDAGRSRTWLPGYRYWIAPTAQRVVCVSDEIFHAFVDAGISPAKLCVVRNGVSLEGLLSRREARKELGLALDARVIGMVARLREEKRHDLALRSVALLHDRGIDATLCVVGDGPEEQALRELAGRLDLEARVVWAGPRENAGRLMRAFDLALICSSIEGMPLAALEALVAGVPLAATAVGALPDLLESGGGTILTAAEPGPIGDTLAAMLAATRGMEDGRAQEWAREAYGIDRVARELESIYDDAVEPPTTADRS